MKKSICTHICARTLSKGYCTECADALVPAPQLHTILGERCIFLSHIDTEKEI